MKNACSLSRSALVTLAAFSLWSSARGNSVLFDGRTYVNQGLVGVGHLPADTRDKFGETFGSFSAFTIDPSTWTRREDGSYSGMLYAQPDRGYNAAGTTNYTPRYNQLSLTFTPTPSGAPTQDQVRLTLSDTVRYHEASGLPMTSLDPTSTGSGARPGFPVLPQAYNGRLSLDAEGIVRMKDGSFFVSDEYGPYIHRFSSDGTLLSTLRPPEALIPKRSGEDSFASNTPGVGQPAPSPVDPTTGRQNNQGLEGLTLSPDGHTLYALLQSATRQDGGNGGSSPRRNTRLFAYDITDPTTPSLKGEYVVQLPTYVDGRNTRVAAQSELLALDDSTFLMLARDGNGLGTNNPTSLFRQVMLVDLDGATNIAGSLYDDPANPISPLGNLVPGISPATTSSFIDINDPLQLAKFGLTNGPANNANNLSEKWEALALAPVLDPLAPNDWFLFVGNDNDFLTRSGFQDGAAYDAGIENSSTVLVYRLTLPASPVPEPSTYASLAAAGLLGLAMHKRFRSRARKLS